MPNLQSYPVFVPIPFTLDIETVTKWMKRKDTPEQGSIFPPPPRSPGDIDITLTTKVTIRVDPQLTSWSETIPLHCHLREPTEPAENSPADGSYRSTYTPGREWIAAGGPDDGEGEKEQFGRWRQRVVYKSSFFLNCPPTFAFKNVDVSVRRARNSYSYYRLMPYVVQHELCFKIPFPGIHNDVNYTVPISVASNMEHPHPSGSGSRLG